MRRFISLLVGNVLVLVSLVMLSACSTVNVVPDPAFRSCLNGLLGQAPDDPLTASQLRHMRVDLKCESMGIVSLEGAQYLTGVTSIYMTFNPISDLTPLAHLTKLHELILDYSEISDLSPLAGLYGLTMLEVSVNQISDLTPLSGLTNLQSLDISPNLVSDLTPLTGLTNLNYLDISSNKVSDLTPLTGLTNIKSLDISNNQISDLAALKTMTKLSWLSLDHNHIRDLSPVAQLPAAVSRQSGFLIGDSQTLTDQATANIPHALPSVTGLRSLTWSVSEGDAIISDGMVTYTAPGTVVLNFTQPELADAGNGDFAGTVTVTVT